MKNLSTIFLLVLIPVVGVFTLDVYLPGMPSMAKDFGVSITQVGFTFTVFSIVFAVCQIFHGVLSDYYGRKIVLLNGLAIAAVATGLCIFAKSYESMVLARIIQAAGISAFVVVNPIIRDLYTGADAIRIRTWVTTVSGISISIAPTIGGLLQNKLNWQGSFIVSLVLTIIALIYTSLFFTESNQNRAKTSINCKLIITSYGKLFTDQTYLFHVLQSTFAYTVHFSFIILSSNIFIEKLGYSPLTFGYLMFIYGGVYFATGLIASSSAKKFTIPALIMTGGSLIGIGGILMLILAFTFSLNAWQILLPMAVITMGITIVRAAATTGALAPIPTQAGQGAGGLNLVQFMLSALIATGISELSNQPELALALLAIICATAIVVLMNHLNGVRFATKSIDGAN